MSNDNNSLAHTKWNCKYHIVFAPKYRRKIFYGEKRVEIGKILNKNVNTIYTLLSRARLLLKEKLGGDDFE